MTPVKKEQAHPKQLVRVSAPARLHLGFLDLNGQTGRKFGSIGLAIRSHQTKIEVKLAPITTVINTTSSPQINIKAKSLIDKFYTSLGQHIPAEQQGIHLSVIQCIPEHAGLGSGTQLALTIGTALCRLHKIAASTADIAAQLGRGSRSGIGIATFDSGGFIVDGGLGKQSASPPLLAHYNFPEHWRIVLINDPDCQGVHGEQELSAFNDLPPFPLLSSQAICHQTLMKLLPALVEQEIEPFGQALTEIQILIGDHFAPVQGGRCTSQRVERVLNYAQQLGHTGIAQSSWGPTGCIFVESDDVAKQLTHQLSQYIKQQPPQYHQLSCLITSANHIGANIESIAL